MKMEITEIEVGKIFPNPNQPRKKFDKEKLIELANSIKSNGLINPIQVKLVKNKYQIVCGERRWRACKLLKLKTIKCIIKIYSSNEKEMVESLVENLQRTNLSFIENENYISALWKTGKYENRRALAKAIGMHRDSVSTTLLAKKVRDLTKTSSTISTRAITDTASVPNMEDRKSILKKVENKILFPGEVRKFSGVLNKSPSDVKSALLKDKISMKQATSISKITDEEVREKLITAHQKIKTIDNGLEKTVKNKLPQKNEVIKIKESINSFRQHALVSQKINQKTAKSLMKCIVLTNVMDDKQLKKLKYYQQLFEKDLDNISGLVENLRSRIEN